MRNCERCGQPASAHLENPDHDYVAPPAFAVAGRTVQCSRHGQFIGLNPSDCPVCLGEPKGPRYDSGRAGVRDRLQNRTNSEPERDDWEWV